MKKLSIIFSLVALAGLSGCLKDKGFEDQKYGIIINEVKGIAFPQASSSPVIIGITGSADPVIVDGPLITREEASGIPAGAVNVTLQYDQALAVAADLEPLPAGSFSLNTLSATIADGVQAFGDLKLTINNSVALDPNVKYGVGFRISGVDQGYQVAENMKTVVFAFAIKNMYDGEYTSEGYFYHPSAPRDVAEDKTVATTSANSVSIGLGDLGGNNYIAILTVDPVTNKVTVTAAPGAAGGPYVQFDAALPNSNPGYTAKWAGSALVGSNGNRYDPATKTFYLRYGYVGGTGYRVTEEIVKRK